MKRYMWFEGEVNCSNFLGVDLKKGSFTNYGVTEKVDRSHAICTMHWVDEDENQVKRKFYIFYLE